MRTITNCRSCGHQDLVEVLNLGDQHLSQFREDATYRPPTYPLVLVVCKSCTLAQLKHSAPDSEMYTETYSFKSGISDAIRADLKDVVDYALAAKPDVGDWLDIACNDGTLLSNVPSAICRVGIDPLRQFAEEARGSASRIISDFFHPNHFDWSLAPAALTQFGGPVGYQQFDVITSISMFYDLDDPNEFVAGVREVLAEDGCWVIQQNYLPSMLENGSVDNLSHEHLAYYSLTSLIPLLARHGLEVVEASLNPINGGCIRTLVTHVGKRRMSRSVTDLLDYEQRKLDIVDLSIYERFAERAKRTLEDLRQLVTGINEKGERVWVYGASTRGAVIWQAAELDVKDLPFVVDRNPDKVGRYMSAIGAPIISEEQMRADPPEYLLVGPWWLRDDFIKREAEFLNSGGRLIFPLPELTIATAEGVE